MNPHSVPLARHGTQPSAPESASATDSCVLDVRGQMQLGPSSRELLGDSVTTSTTLGPNQEKGEAIGSNRWFLPTQSPVEVLPSNKLSNAPPSSFLPPPPLPPSFRFLPLFPHLQLVPPIQETPSRPLPCLRQANHALLR
jgi:hypothetical protein